VPIAVAVVVLVALHVPESGDLSVTGKIDYAGALVAAVLLTGITFAFIPAPALGWSSPAVLAMAVAGAVGWLPSWSGSTLRPRRCCRFRSSRCGSSRRPRWCSAMAAPTPVGWREKAESWAALDVQQSPGFSCGKRGVHAPFAEIARREQNLSRAPAASAPPISGC
jgi:hypothetical protein